MPVPTKLGVVLLQGCHCTRTECLLSLMQFTTLAFHLLSHSALRVSPCLLYSPCFWHSSQALRVQCECTLETHNHGSFPTPTPRSSFLKKQTLRDIGRTPPFHLRTLFVVSSLKERKKGGGFEKCWHMKYFILLNDK